MFQLYDSTEIKTKSKRTWEDCGNWCTFKGNHTGKQKNLPRGLDLSNNSLKNDLMSIFKTLDAGKLSKFGTSNVNESFKNILRYKAPKDKHYSESSRLAHRLSYAVCQKMKVMTMLQRYKFEFVPKCFKDT